MKQTLTLQKFLKISFNSKQDNYNRIIMVPMIKAI